MTFRDTWSELPLLSTTELLLRVASIPYALAIIAIVPAKPPWL